LKEQLRTGQVELLDHPESLKELRALESRITGSGHMQVTAPSGFHDDFADILALGSFKAFDWTGSACIAWADPEPTPIRRLVDKHSRKMRLFHN
jgi:hypothetical protein